MSFSNTPFHSQFAPHSQENLYNLNENYSYSQDEASFPMSQHFQQSQGDGSFPNFSSSYRSRAASVERDDDNNEEEDKGSRKFWRPCEEEVLVKAWLTVSQNKGSNTKQTASIFWTKITKMFKEVKCYRDRCWEEGVESLKESDILQFDRELGQIQSQWKRIHAKVSKFVGAYAHAESRRKSGESDDDIMKTAFAIYKKDNKTYFNKLHCWEILRLNDVWKPMGDTVKACKKKTVNQESGSKRWRINETGNYSTSSEPNTPSSGDPTTPNDGFTKNKGKGKVLNMPAEAFQEWMDQVQKLNLEKNNELQVEIQRINHEKESNNEMVRLERDKIAIKNKKINLKLLKVLSSRNDLNEEEQELKRDLVKVLSPM
ncbi:glutathione S-transferase T3-like [Beta vulgaris subsp. vulgaris]|uniref:glutathione S-transferase T3-like n=1 Tax=Beta vulgaris subsp. vulgaris TaxID=3555 RepID=UPI0020375091|nr:glutathione S-transferase T3-like [Beta vulgaris subsp. vulgaris]